VTNPKSIESFAKGLLATTCLTMAAGSAVAGTITEGTPPAPAQFPTASTGYQLPVGTTQVFGSLTGEGIDNQAWFEFTGLTPGEAFTITGMYTTPNQRPTASPINEAGVVLNLFTDGGVLLASQTLEQVVPATKDGFTFSGSVPGEGKLDVQIQFRNVESVEAGGSPVPGPGSKDPLWVVNLDPGASTPEPSTMGLAGTGMALGASALAWRRRRKQ
jgi:hypothetical protein